MEQSVLGGWRCRGGVQGDAEGGKSPAALLRGPGAGLERQWARMGWRGRDGLERGTGGARRVTQT